MKQNSSNPILQMVDLIASNEKLAQRSRNILRGSSTRCFSMTEQSLDELLVKCDRSVKLALVVVEKDLTVEQGRQQLKDADGVLDRVLHPGKDIRSQKSPIHDFGSSAPVVLCIDGGGSKCAAVTATSKNVRGQGISGPCNLYVFGSFFTFFRLLTWYKTERMANLT